MLENDDVVIEQALLFAVHVDAEIRVLGVQVDQGDAVDAGGGPGHWPVDLRTPQRGVGEQYQDLAF